RGLLRMQRVHQRTLKGLVVFREWSVVEAERHEQTSDALGVHDERAHVIFGCGIDFEIRNVNARPALLGFVPPNLAARRIPGLALEIAGGAVIEDAAIRRPRPSPIGINAETGWVFRSAALHHGAGFGPRSAVEPVSRERCAVVLEPGKARELLA